nr:cyclase family protein [Rhodococcus sp. 06-621-2]
MNQHATALADILSGAQIVDLSVLTGERWPVVPPEGQIFSMTVRNDFGRPDGLFGYYKGYTMIHDDHSGTHIDAPSHMIPPPDSGLPFASEYGNISVDKIPVDQMLGAAVVVDARRLMEGQPRGEVYQYAESAVITREFLEEWEEENGRIEPGSIVLFRTDWSDNFYKPIPDGYLYDRSHPAPGADAYELLDERGVRCIGIDARGLGLLQDDYTPHRAALGRNIVGIENLTNLGSIPVRGAYFIFLPHKFEDASGGMGRAIAVVPNVLDAS